MRGRGFAYALYVHSKFPGYGAAWSAWIADVAVNKATGEERETFVKVVSSPHALTAALTPVSDSAPPELSEFSDYDDSDEAIATSRRRQS